MNQSCAIGILGGSDGFPCSIGQASTAIALAASGSIPSRCRAMSSSVSCKPGVDGLKPLLMHQQVIAGNWEHLRERNSLSRQAPSEP